MRIQPAQKRNLQAPSGSALAGTLNERKILTFTFAAHFLFHFYEILFPAMAVPLMLSLKMNLPQVLKLGFFMYLLFGVTALPWGIFADRFGNRNSLVIFFLGGGAGALLAAASHTGPALMISLASIGLFGGIYHSAGMGLIARGMRNRGTALGVNAVAGSIGLAAAPFAAGLLNWAVGWRAGYLMIGAFAILWGIIMALVPIDEAAVRREESVKESDSERKERFRTFLILCAIVALGGLAYRVNIVVLPAYLEFKAGFLGELLRRLSPFRAAGLETAAAATLTSIVYVIGIFGQLAGGRLADRHDLRRLYFSFNAASLPFALLMAVAGGPWLVLAAAGYAFFALGIQPIENSLIAKFAPGGRQSTGFGITAVLIFGVGALAIYPVGWIKALWNLGAVYFFSAQMIVLVLIGIRFLGRSLNGKSCRN